MEIYGKFANIYDSIMTEVPYDEWLEIILDILKENEINDGIVADIACGSGEMTIRMADKGYDMIGLDMSPSMLERARDKSTGRDILYICQDMREMEFYGTIRAAICMFDSINYLTEYEDLVQTFKLVNNYLDIEGLWIFDFNTIHKYRMSGEESTIAEDDEEISFIWNDTFYEEDDINEIDITFFVKQENGLYERFNECHIQRGYDLETMKAAIEESGLIFVKAIDANTKKEADDNSERIIMVARENGKKERYAK